MVILMTNNDFLIDSISGNPMLTINYINQHGIEI